MTTPTPAQQAAEVLRLSEQATPGPWEIIYERYHEGIAYIKRDPETGEITYCETVQGTDANDSFEDFKYPDEKLVLFYRTAAPAIAQALLDALERLATVEAERDGLVRALRSANETISALMAEGFGEDDDDAER